MIKVLEIPRRFAGPPNIANGGYVAGLMSVALDGEWGYSFKAPVPLATPIRLEEADGAPALTADDRVCVQAIAATELPPLPTPPAFDEARAAGGRAVASFHRECVCCSQLLAPEDCLHVEVGSLNESGDGIVAGTWSLPASFGDAQGLAPAEIVWAALDCPGFYAWVDIEGKHFALTASMGGRIWRRPSVGEECIILAWTGAKVSERRRTANVALFLRTGEPLAQMAQSWVRLSRKDTGGDRRATAGPDSRGWSRLMASGG